MKLRKTQGTGAALLVILGVSAILSAGGWVVLMGTAAYELFETNLLLAAAGTALGGLLIAVAICGTEWLAFVGVERWPDAWRDGPARGWLITALTLGCIAVNAYSGHLTLKMIWEARVGTVEVVDVQALRDERADALGLRDRFDTVDMTTEYGVMRTQTLLAETGAYRGEVTGAADAATTAALAATAAGARAEVRRLDAEIRAAEQAKAQGEFLFWLFWFVVGVIEALKAFGRFAFIGAADTEEQAEDGLVESTAAPEERTWTAEEAAVLPRPPHAPGQNMKWEWVRRSSGQATLMPGYWRQIAGYRQTASPVLNREDWPSVPVPQREAA